MGQIWPPGHILPTTIKGNTYAQVINKRIWNMKVFGEFFHFIKIAENATHILRNKITSNSRMIKEMRKSKAILVLEPFLSCFLERLFFPIIPKALNFHSDMRWCDLIFFLSFYGPFKSRKSSSSVWKCSLNYFVNFLTVLFQEHMFSVLFSTCLPSRILFLFFALHPLCPGEFVTFQIYHFTKN